MTTIKLKSIEQQGSAIERLRDTPLGKNFEMVIRKCKRTNPQNNTFHLWCSEIARDTECYTMEQIKQLMKKKYGVWTVNDVYGQLIVSAKSTAKYSTKEMADLMEGVQAFAAEFGIQLSNPADMGRYI